MEYECLKVKWVSLLLPKNQIKYWKFVESEQSKSHNKK